MSTVAATTRAPRATAWRNAIFVIFALNGFGMSAWISRVPSVRDHLTLTTADVGLLIFGLSAGSVIGLIASGHIVAHIGGRASIRMALATDGLALALIGFGTTVLSSFTVVFIGLALYGLCSALCDVAMNVEGTGVERAAGRTILPLFHASWSLGTVIGAALGSAAAYLGVDPLWHLSAVGVIHAGQRNEKSNAIVAAGAQHADCATHAVASVANLPSRHGSHGSVC
jgi:MFS family permease